MTKRYNEAQKYFQKALAGREDQVQNGVRAAPGEPITILPELSLADTCREWGILKQAQGDLDGAEILHRRSLSLAENHLGPDHTWTLLSIADLGAVSLARGQMAIAEGHLNRALNGMEEHLGETHQYTVKIYLDLGEVLLTMGREEALAFLDKASRGSDGSAAAEARKRIGHVRNIDILEA